MTKSQRIFCYIPDDYDDVDDVENLLSFIIERI